MAGGKHVIVIGADIAGLVTAKVLHEDGFDVLVLDKAAHPGGVWIESRTYPGLRTNNSRHTYAFSDHPYPPSAPLFPTAPDVRAYLASYMDRFDLEPLLRLRTEVVRVSHAGNGVDGPDAGSGRAEKSVGSAGTSVDDTAVESARTGAESDSAGAGSDRMRTAPDGVPADFDDGGEGFEVEVIGPAGRAILRCDFVVVCAGVFSEPRVPVIAGAERFAGARLHSSAASDPELFAGKRVVVVGAGKSALDCAAWAAEHAADCTLVFRQPHWMVPRYLPGGSPADVLLVSRFGEMLLPYHRMNRVERFLHGPGRIVPRLLWLFVGFACRILLPIPRILVPEHPMPAGIENVGLGHEFFRMVQRGRVDLRRDAIAATPGGSEIVLESGARMAADVLVFATGWRQSLSFLSPELEAAVRTDGRFRLYRHILPPTEQRLGFIGYASSTACQLGAEISAHWLSQAFRGELDLPPVPEMQRETLRVATWLAKVLPARSEGYFLGPYLSHHIDDLMRDMRLPTRRTGNILTEYLDGFFPTRYRDLPAERRRAREGIAPQPNPTYLTPARAMAGLALLGSAYALVRRAKRPSNRAKRPSNTGPRRP
ncbi:flavin-containing monooxygenase [Nocardia sp. NPDC088792]|uniref:flavin-containing monooxygenase n=1 Tax=Nocardia sp. NPDC088792 TaxID=3364332 RepID=UPI0037FED278